jgi:3',5'-cyclic-AMP phosphodiesterase
LIIRVDSVDQEPFHTVEYRHAGPRGRVVEARLPVLAGVIEGLPPELEGILCLSDLQGVEPPWRTRGSPRLLGELLAEELGMLSEMGELPPAKSIGVILAGDLYALAESNQRGAGGDVRPEMGPPCVFWTPTFA